MTMNMKDATIDEIITNMSKETSYRFLYQVEEVLKYGKRDLNVKNAALEEVLNQLLKGTSLSYEIQNEVVIITPVKEEKKEEKKRVIKGKVIDIQKVPLPGVTVVIKGTTLGVSDRSRRKIYHRNSQAGHDHPCIHFYRHGKGGTSS